ncbi:glycosyltransferase family 4 protein [Candidatus Nitrosacidococcus tergens]|uniref:Putative Glycosyl transferase group 1 n=1 Tax=Candidatus Nitrosacidococcus tergens TaxID=553981 RepID=A0A7G1QA41_9GAMM|nr:glycosyltransferase family 4 protein [Candidatus Nitrosacidococcus tergens]CAB1275813.1 putative Glycosyl transferase group 1 [Candidatus Nitrosacidococcus tergens]
MTKIIYWNNIPAPYMIERFNTLSDRSNLDFEVWFNDRVVPDRSWAIDEATWKFNYRYLPAISLFGKKFHFPPMQLLTNKIDILISLYSEPVVLISWLIAYLKGVKTVFICEITWDRWIKRRWWKEKIKHIIFPLVDAVISPGENGKSYAMRYGASSSKIFTLIHVINVRHYTLGQEKVLLNRDEIRTQLNLKGCTFIYVGRLWWGKGINYLLEAFAKVQQQSNVSVSLLLVGDGSEESVLKQVCQDRNIKNVIFTGFKQQKELPQYYALADIFIFPTLGDPYGLVVDEAMACALPIISTSAAGEIHDRIEEGINGYIVPPEDSETLADRMLHLVNNPKLCKKMSKASAEKIADHTLERWAENFEKIVYQLMSRPDLR